MSSFKMWPIAIFMLFFLRCSAQTGEHIDWPRWCGKAYMPLYPDFNPGGQLTEPPKQRDRTLNLRFKPRYNIFLADESEGEFFVHAQASRYHGFSWPWMEKDDYWPPEVNFTITNTATGEVLVRNMLKSSRSGHRKATSDRPVYRYKFDLGKFKPSFDPYEVTFHATPSLKNKHGAPSWLGEHNFSVKSEIYVLPSKSKGTITKIDNLSGGLLFRNSTPGSKFEPFFPYGFYAPCEGFLCDANYTANIKAYHDRKLNSMVPMMPASSTSLDVYGTLDSLNMRYMYDLRQSYKNHSALREQVEAIKDSDGLYAYWTFDQPDGHSATHVPMWKASSLIKEIDPYHPIAISLSCDNYYFEEYTKAADIIVADAHPIGASISASKWHTNCNTTYGNCGCDNCRGTVTDVSDRLDKMVQYERWLNHWPKPKMQSLQTGPGGENHLPISPSADEVVAMSALALNHGAKGIFPWAWPVDDEIAAVHDEFADVMNIDFVKEILSKTRPTMFKMPKYKYLDISYWLFNRTLILSIVNLGEKSHIVPVKFDIPHIEPTLITHVLWGNAVWEDREIEKPFGMKLRATGLDPLSTNIVVTTVCCDGYPSLSKDLD